MRGLDVGGLRAEVKAQCGTDEAGECRQELIEQLLGFVEVAMRGVESGSGDGEQREDQRKRDGSAHPVTSWLWVVSDVGRHRWDLCAVDGGWLCVNIGTSQEMQARAHKKGPRWGLWSWGAACDQCSVIEYCFPLR